MPATAHPRFIFYLLCAASLLVVVRTDPAGSRNQRRYEDSNEDIAYEAAKQLGQLNYRLNLLAFEEQSRQISLPNVTVNDLGYELFERNFDCLLFGEKGVKIVKPEEGYPVRPTDVEIDDSDEQIEEYDENVVRRRRRSRLSKVMRSKRQV